MTLLNRPVEDWLIMSPKNTWTGKTKRSMAGGAAMSAQLRGEGGGGRERRERRERKRERKRERETERERE